MNEVTILNSPQLAFVFRTNPEYRARATIKVVSAYNGKVRYYTGYYDKPSLEKRRDELVYRDYSYKPQVLQEALDKMGRITRLVRLGSGSKYAGQYAVRYRSNHPMAIWQIIYRSADLTQAKEIYNRRISKRWW